MSTVHVMSRWWWRPLRAITTGVAAGLVLTWLIGRLSGTSQVLAIFLLLGALMIFCVWQMRDLRRLEREARHRMREWEAILQRHDTDWREED